ncbi:hypothetical protein SDC9_212845 [bioreactor metagenome]|uniref:Uncharacterized protein n=1 Tax=bioreactor metagenome TaxID=1076179 RepID=A0A645JNW6_9ZZZZ
MISRFARMYGIKRVKAATKSVLPTIKDGDHVPKKPKTNITNPKRIIKKLKFLYFIFDNKISIFFASASI